KRATVEFRVSRPQHQPSLRETAGCSPWEPGSIPRGELSMRVGLKRGAPAKARASFLCVPLFEGESLKNGWIGDLDAASGGVVAALARAGDFTGRLGTQTLLYNPEASGPKRIHLIGAGNPDQLDLERIRQTASRAVKRAAELNLQDVTILFP